MVGAPLRELVDTSDLDGPRIEVAPRIGWLLRMARATAARTGPVARGTLIARAREHGDALSASGLSRLEAGRRCGAECATYERALGLAPGSLRVPIDILCRTFPYSPRDSTELPLPDLTRLSGFSARVLQGPPTGGDWLEWARALAHPSARGFPLWLLEPLLDRLVSELGRSVGSGYPIRYEALCLLRSGPYAEHVLRAAARALAEPHVQVLFDLLSAISEYPDQAATDLFAVLLADPRPQVVQGAVLGISNALSVGGPDAVGWGSLVDPLVTAYNASGPGTEHFRSLSGLLVALPPAVRAQVSPRLARPPGRTPRNRPKGPRLAANQQWRTATALAREISTAIGRPQEPVLERLLFEVLYDDREPRAVTSSILLAAVPFVEEVVAALVRFGRTATTPASTAAADRAGRVHALRRVAAMQTGCCPGVVADWPREDDPVLDLERVAIRAQCGIAPDVGPADLATAPGRYGRRRYLYAAGMSAAPVLDAWADAEDPDLAGAARWWRDQGPLVRDPPPHPEAR